MKKVLIIAYSFPPASNISAQRPYNLAKYLPKYGWQPIILTPKLPGKRPQGINVIETEYQDIVRLFKSRAGFDSDKGIQKQLGIDVSKNFIYAKLKSIIIKLIKEIICYPDARRNWYKPALKSAVQLLYNHDINAIVSTSSPVTCHLIARKLKQKYKIPWIADLRDLWTQNPYHNKFRAIKYFERRLELKTLFDADALVTVTDSWIHRLRLLHKNKKIFCVTNGFNEEEFENLPTKLTNKFTITYTGWLYNGKRDPSMLFEVVAQLIKEHKISKELLEINFYGDAENCFINEIRKYKLEGVVKSHGIIPRQETLKRQKESQLLLLLIWNHKNEEGFCPGKIYEYFGARRPIIAIGWHGSIVKEMLEITNAGKLVRNNDELSEVLLNYYREFITSGEVRCHSNSNIASYRYLSITERYSKILNDLV